MYLSIIILPLLGSIVSGFFGRKVGVRGAQIITCSCVIVTTILALLAFVEVGFNNIPVTINLFRWIDSEWFNIIWGFQFDALTVSMLIPVLIISSLVHIYSIGYMSGDPHQQRFFSYLSLFTFMMIVLVTGNNYLLMFVGWEGVGVCSYLLVCFWFTRIAANQSSISALLTNRVGDCILTIGMFAILWTLGNLDYATVFSLAPYINENVLTMIGICLVIGAMAKSSQVGLHVWLPMAMEGPTPVSALIHAATMVTAGVYLLMRSSPLIEYSSTVLLICLWLGAITTVFSSLVGLFQQDIKKVIAYSTMSQLGMMVIAIGLSSYNIALFHLVNHAFYKALLFLGAGAVIHAVADNQDFRRYGGLISFLPLTYSVILIASLSLVAFPFMTGFYSKDFILESAFGQYHFSSIAVYVIATIGAIFTTLYSVKVLYLTFLTNPNGPITSYKHAHESDMFISLPLIILAIFSIFFGFVTKDIFIGLGSSFFVDNSIFINPIHEIMIDTEFAVPTLFKILPFIFTVSFSILAIVLSEFLPGIVINFKLSKLGRNIFGFFNQRFLVEMFYNNYITNLVLYLGGQTTKVLDKGAVELVGPFGLEKALINFSKSLTKLSTGVVTSYALYILVGLISFIFILYLSEISASLIVILIILASFSLNENKKDLRENLEYKVLPLTSSNYRIGRIQSSFISNKANVININKTLGNISFRQIKLYTTNSSPDIELFNLFRSSFIIDNLNNYILKMSQNKGISLKTDIYGFICNKQIPDKKSLLKKYPDILELEDQLSYDFERNNTDLSLFLFFKNKIYTQWQDLSSLIKDYNGCLTMPKFYSFLSEKEVVLRYLNYNTPNSEDVTITPLVGTNYKFMSVDINDKNPLSLYQQWVLSLYYLIWEYNILLDVYLILQSSGNDLYKGIEDINSGNYIYWLNRQRSMQRLDDSLIKDESFIMDFYTNKLAFKRETFEDIIYVALNLILAHNIINSFERIDNISEDEFFNILTNIIKEHYIIYSKEYKFLKDLRLYKINNYFSTKDILETYNYQIKCEAKLS